MGNVAIVIETFLRSLIWLIIPGKRGLEILMLRKELQVLKRQVKRPRFTVSDRLFFFALLKLIRPAIHRLITIQSLNLNAPSRTFETKISVDNKRIRRTRIVDDLVVDYRLAV